MLFKQWLKNEEVEEGRTAVLRCELTRPHAHLEWRKGDTRLQPGDKYEFRQEGTRAELLIYGAEAQDAGEYTCDSGDQQTTATLQVKGRTRIILARLDGRTGLEGSLLMAGDCDALGFSFCVF